MNRSILFVLVLSCWFSINLLDPLKYICACEHVVNEEGGGGILKSELRELSATIFE